MANSEENAINGAYMALGLFSDAPDNFLSDYAQDGGHLGLVYDICKYSEYILDLYSTGISITDDNQGVFEYEVVKEFGKWFQQSLINGRKPTPDMCRVRLLNDVQSFFCEDENDDIIEAVGEALMSVPFNVAQQPSPSVLKIR
jgi:hypothetical protein